MTNITPPSIDSTSFNCPHCAALAHQTWYTVYVDQMEKDTTPFIPSEEMIDSLRAPEHLPMNEVLTTLTKLANGEVFIAKGTAAYRDSELKSVWISKCYSCNKMALWLHQSVIYPSTRYTELPNENLPEDVRRDYDEASAVLETSPRSAAALLRLCVQKICKHLGEKGINLNDDIASLVSKGLDVQIQQALDIVRVAGNNAVHPGTMDLRDNRRTAIQLFQLVNLIVERMISQPKHIDALFDTLPETARIQIAQRGK